MQKHKMQVKHVHLYIITLAYFITKVIIFSSGEKALCFLNLPGDSFSSATLFISSSTVSLSTSLAFQHADWTRACESSRYPGGPPTGPSVAGKVSSFVLQRDGWATATNIVVAYLGSGRVV